jgi:hypothetical protein
MAAMNTRSAQHLDVPTTGRRLDQLKIAVAAMRSALWDMERAIEEIEPMNLSPETGLYVTREVPEVDPLVYRVGELREGCEAILKRPLNALERGIVMSWSSLERDAELVPVTEILDLTQQCRRCSAHQLPPSVVGDGGIRPPNWRPCTTRWPSNWNQGRQGDDPV